MLLRMLPDDIKPYWDEMRDAIRESLPAYSGEHGSIMNDILVSILTGKITVWLSYQWIEGKQVIDALATTTFVYNDFSKTKSLLIYTVYGYEHIPEESWQEAFIAISQWGKGNNCDNIITYTDNQRIIDLGKQFNGNITNVITFPIGG